MRTLRSLKFAAGLCLAGLCASAQTTNSPVSQLVVNLPNPLIHYAGVWGVTPTANGIGYVPGDTITPTIPGATSTGILGGAYGSAALYVATTQVVSATVNAGGTSCAGSSATLTGTTGTGGSGAFFTATAPVSAGAIQNPITITSGGSYRVNPTSLSAEPVTGDSCSGAQLNVVMGIQYVNVQNPGSYSALTANPLAATQASTSGSGTGATFSVTFAPQAAYVLPPINSPNFGAQNVNQAAYNFGVGYQTLNAVTSGIELTAFGWGALHSNTTGGYNTAFGLNALGSLTTTSNNAAFGRDAMRNFTTGSGGNSAFGDGAAVGNSGGATGTANTVIGSASAQAITTAANNTIVGAASASAITTAQQNTIIGENAGVAIQGGGNNTIVGHSAGNLIVTGASNTIIGESAGTKITGSANVVLGPNVASTTLTSGGNNVIIGTTANCDADLATRNHGIFICADSTAIITVTGAQTPSTAPTTISGTLAVAGITADTGHTDATVCEDTTSHQFYSGTGTLGVCLGTSSIRFKRETAYLVNESSMAKVMALKPVSYRYKDGYGDSGVRRQYGFLAEDVVDAAPLLVHYDPQGQPNSVDYVGMIPLLVGAIQEQQREIAELKAELRRR